MTRSLSAAGTRPRFLTDVNFNRRIISGLRRQAPELDSLTAQELGLGEEPDERLLQQAQALDRILLSHDINTMPRYFATRLGDNEHSPGAMLIAQNAPIGIAIQALLEVLEVWKCSAHEEWHDRIVFLPL